jgi:2'-5' RNA ligase
MIRLFVAIALPDAVKDRIALLGGGIPGAKWIDRDNLHLTLQFIGEMPEDRLGDIHHALSRIRQRPFELAVAGIGHFSQGRNATMLWVGVDRNEGLVQLRDKVVQALKREGVEGDGQRFAPHITLARLQRVAEARLADYVAAHNLFRLPPLTVTSFTLFSSFLSSSRAIYTAEAEYPLLENQQP